jgi:hypothetical protein
VSARAFMCSIKGVMDNFMNVAVSGPRGIERVLDAH